jgi:hypothetical protein
MLYDLIWGAKYVPNGSSSCLVQHMYSQNARHKLLHVMMAILKLFSRREIRSIAKAGEGAKAIVKAA